MNFKINLEINKDINENDIIIDIKTSRNSEVLQQIVSYIELLENRKNSLIGFIDNELYVISTDSILYFYTKEQKCYCRTEDKDYYIKKRLYEIEDMLNEEFIRISNSCIINIRKIKYFDLNKTGNIGVKFINGDMENVSKRNISQIKKIIKERWN